MAERNKSHLVVLSHLWHSYLSALIIYGGAEDYTVRFQQKGDDFLVDDDHCMLKRDNHSLIIAFPSGMHKSNIRPVAV